MARGCGTWDDILENWTLPRYYAMQDYWQEVAPPLDVLIAGFMGWKPKKRKAEKKGDLGDLIAMFGGSGGMIQ